MFKCKVEASNARECNVPNNVEEKEEDDDDEE